jgi:hypothetical protein
MGKKMLPLIFVLLSCSILAKTGTVDAQPISTISVQSKTINTPSEKFTIQINITDAPTMDFYAITNITWNPSIMELEHGTDADVVEGTFMKNVGSSVFISGDINNTEGRVGDTGCGFLSGGPASGSGLLLTLKFQSKAVGVSDVKIDFAYLLNGPDVADMPQLQNGTVNVVPEFSASLLLPIFLTTSAIAIFAATAWRKRRIQIRIP